MKRHSFLRRRFNPASFLKTDRWRAVRRIRTGQKYISPTLAGIAWLDALADLVFTPQGRILLIAFLPIAFFALLLTRSPAFLLFVLIVVMFAADLLGKLFFPRRVKLERTLPVRAVCGVPFEIRTRVRNDSPLPAYDFDLNRNLGPLLVRQDPDPPLYCLGGRSETVIRQTWLLRRRGIYELPPVLAEGLFPFRLIKARRSGKIRQEIICHPACMEFQQLRLPGGRCLPGPEEMSGGSRPGDSLDFLGCREYRNGDDPRKIDWNASARRNRLVVKEFEEEQMSSAAIILDNYCPAGWHQSREWLKRLLTLKPLLRSGEEPFEAAVSLTASIANSLARRNFVIDLFVSGSEIHHFRTGRSTMTFEAFLDLLSALEPAGSEKRFEHLPGGELNRAAGAGAVFLILLHVDPESEKLHRSLQQRGANLRTLVLDGGTAELPAWAERLNSGEILQNRRTEL